MKILLLNPYMQYLLFNAGVLILYVCQLSTLYDVKLDFVVYYISTLFFFFVFNMKSLGEYRKILSSDLRVLLIPNKKRLVVWTYIVFVIGATAALVQVYLYGATIFEENKVMRIQGMHYLGYLVNLLEVSMIFAYICLTFHLSKYRWVMKSIFIFSMMLLLLKMNRGAFSFPLLVFLYVSYFQAVSKGRTRRWIWKVFIGICLALLGFGFIGDLRVSVVMETFYQMTINEFYGINEIFPTSFVWSYIYLTSPLENASRIFAEQSVWEYHMGLNMIYPFIAPIFRLFYNSPRDLFPPLADEAGLTVSSYLIDAWNDFGYIGPYIYMMYLSLLYYLAQRVMYNIYGLLCFVCIIDMGLWMVFVNAFAIGGKMIFYLLFLFLACINRPRRVCIDERGEEV